MRKPKLKFVWDMTKEEWKRLLKDHEECKIVGDDYYGNCKVGDLCVEVRHSDGHPNISWYAFGEIYNLGGNDGYGKTPSGKPYSNDYDGFVISLDSRTFWGFKKEFEKALLQEICCRDGLLKFADRPLGNWD